MYKYAWKTCHKGHNRFMKNTRVDLATFTQCIDHILATKSSWYPTAKLSLLYPTPRASRQICGLQWDGDSDSLSVFDGLCQSLSFERKGRQLYWVYNAWSSRPMITPCMSHIQNSHGILSRFPLKGGREEADTSPLKWSYHSGCRPTGKPDSYSLPSLRVALAVSWALNDRQAGQQCYAAILLLITRSGVNLSPHLFMHIVPFSWVELKLDGFDSVMSAAMGTVHDTCVFMMIKNLPYSTPKQTVSRLCDMFNRDTEFFSFILSLCMIDWKKVTKKGEKNSL